MTEISTAERPLVTFALFAYNQEKYIREAVEGAFSQTYEPLEIILSDDCSPDRTYEIMQEMAAAYQGPHKVIVRRNKTNLGLASHLNSVLAICSGEIVSWAAGDDISLPERTAVLCQPLLDNVEIVGVHSSVLEIDEEGRTLRTRRRKEADRHFDIASLAANPKSMTTQSHAFRKYVFDSFGPFREDLTHEGYAMTFREAALGKIYYIDMPLTKYRIGTGVSNYRGRNISRLKLLEPVKISKWHHTAALQMLDDIAACSDIFDRKLKNNAANNEKITGNILAINTGKSLIRPLLHNLLLSPFDMRSIRAVIRKTLPDRLYGVLRGADHT